MCTVVLLWHTQWQGFSKCKLLNPLACALCSAIERYFYYFFPCPSSGGITATVTVNIIVFLPLHFSSFMQCHDGRFASSDKAFRRGWARSTPRHAVSSRWSRQRCVESMIFLQIGKYNCTAGSTKSFCRTTPVIYDEIFIFTVRRKHTWEIGREKFSSALFVYLWLRLINFIRSRLGHVFLEWDPPSWTSSGDPEEWFMQRESFHLPFPRRAWNKLRTIALVVYVAIEILYIIHLTRQQMMIF